MVTRFHMPTLAIHLWTSGPVLQRKWSRSTRILCFIRVHYRSQITKHNKKFQGFMELMIYC